MREFEGVNQLKFESVTGEIRDGGGGSVRKYNNLRVQVHSKSVVGRVLSLVSSSLILTWRAPCSWKRQLLAAAERDEEWTV